MTDAENTPALDGIANVYCYETLIAEQEEEFRLAAIRRTRERRDLLHLRDHGQSQGCAVFAPRNCPRRHDHLHAGECCWSVYRENACCRSCRCFTSMAGALRMAALVGGAKLVLPGPRLDGPGLVRNDGK